MNHPAYKETGSIKQGRGLPGSRAALKLVAFNDWITIRVKTSGPLSNSINKGNNMLRVGITSTGTLIIINRRRKQGGVDKFSPHDLRRSLIGDRIDMDIDLVVISQLVGHSSINATVGTTAETGDKSTERSRQNFRIKMCIETAYPKKAVWSILCWLQCV